MPTNLSTIVSFTTSKFPIASYQTEDAPGRDLAEFIRKEFASQGAKVESDTAVGGEGGWSLWFTIAGQRLRLFLNVAGLDEPIRDYWVISYHRAERGLAGLLKRKIDAKKFEAVVEITNDVISRKLLAPDAHWWTDEAFGKALLA